MNRCTCRCHNGPASEAETRALLDRLVTSLTAALAALEPLSETLGYIHGYHAAHDPKTPAVLHPDADH